jgi:hypothetical protein
MIAIAVAATRYGALSQAAGVAHEDFRDSV